MTGLRAPTREELLRHLVTTRIAGDVATPRESNLRNIDKMLAREPEYWFGLELDRPWTPDEVLSVLAKHVGMDPDPTDASGTDTIDPQLCVDALDDARQQLAAVAARHGRVLLATGHPTGLLALLLPVAAALATAGCEVITPADGAWLRIGEVARRIRYIAGVAVVGTNGDLMHTHAPEPMHTILKAMGDRPDLVVADHGWAGAAGQAGITTVGFADTNDPALFVGAEEGKLAVAVPLDDNVLPTAYAPLATYLVTGIA